MRKFKLILFAVLFVISAAILILLFSLGYNESIDPEYAVSVFEQDVVTQQFEFSEFDRLYFFSDHDPLTRFTKKTKLLGATPSLKIINSDKYRVEIKANADVFDALKIATSDGTDDQPTSLIVTFSDECYVPVHIDDSSYDYDTGLYVDFDAFDVTVYAPISSLFVDSEVVLDYQAPTCDKLNVEFSYEGTKANIYDINAKNLVLICSGDSDISLSGEVKGKSEIMVFHETKVNANELTTNTKDFYVSSSVLLGFSYIKYNDHFYFDLAENFSRIIFAAILYLPPIIWLTCFLCSLRKKRK